MDKKKFNRLDFYKYEYLFYRLFGLNFSYFLLHFIDVSSFLTTFVTNCYIIKILPKTN